MEPADATAFRDHDFGRSKLSGPSGVADRSKAVRSRTCSDWRATSRREHAGKLPRQEKNVHDRKRRRAKTAKRKPAAAAAVDRDRGLAAQPVAALALRGVFHPEPSGDAKQPSVRGHRGDDHGVELRRMGRVRPAAKSAGPGTGPSRTRPPPVLVWSRSARSAWFSCGSGRASFTR